MEPVPLQEALATVLIDEALTLYGDEPQPCSWIYGSTHRPLSAVWAKIPDTRFVNSSLPGVYTWVIAERPLEQAEINAYELTYFTKQEQIV